MRRPMRVLFCVSVTASLLALGAASASAAAPELGRCVKKEAAGGTGFSSARCTTAATGSEAKFKWEAGPGPFNKFVSRAREVPTTKQRRCTLWKEEVEKGNTKHAEELLEEWKYTAPECETTLKEGENKVPVLLETVSGLKTECTGQSATGEYTGPKTVGNVKVTFTGCENTALKTPCGSGSASSGEIVSNVLQGEVGVIKGETNPINSTVGIRLEAVPGSDVSDFECVFGEGTISVKITGSVIHQVTKNLMILKENEKFQQHKGLQKPENFEGGTSEVLYSSIGGQSGESLLTELENEEKIELNTVV